MAELDPNTLVLAAAQLTSAHMVRAAAMPAQERGRNGSIETVWDTFERYRQRLQPSEYTRSFAVDLEEGS